MNSSFSFLRQKVFQKLRAGLEFWNEKERWLNLVVYFVPMNKIL
jgi:hypothetical protein